MLPWGSCKVENPSQHQQTTNINTNTKSKYRDKYKGKYKGKYKDNNKANTKANTNTNTNAEQSWCQEMFSAGYRKYARYAMRPQVDMPAMPTFFIQNIYSPQFLD